jgi:hypothetical protein
MVRPFVFIKIIIVLTAMLASVSAQTRASVVGIVTDQNGDAIKGARVEALSLTSEPGSMTRTDSLGKYELSGLSAGEIFRWKPL